MNNKAAYPHIYKDYKYADFFINKETEYPFSGSKLSFALSHALFSSFEVDSGSRLLLKTLVPYMKKLKAGSIMDAGCGTGILGTALKKTAPDADLYLYDRDSLAVYFTEMNLEKNGIHDYSVSCSLLMFPYSERKFDIIVSNLPAKAGKEVLGDFIQQAPFHLTGTGIAAVVIVKPLSDFAEETLKINRLDILESVKTANYSVFVFRYPEDMVPAGIDEDTPSFIKTDEELFKSYIRKEKQQFEIKGNVLNIDTATGLPDFDTLSFNSKHACELIISMKDALKSDKKQLVINPGQGLVPVLMKSLSLSSEEILISSNDILQLKITERNLSELSPSETRIYLNQPTVLHTADIIDKGSLDTVIFFYPPVPGFKKHDLVMKNLNRLLKPGGKLVIASTASEISRFLSCSSGFANVRGKKNKGTRAVYLKKTADA